MRPLWWPSWRQSTLRSSAAWSVPVLCWCCWHVPSETNHPIPPRLSPSPSAQLQQIVSEVQECVFSLSALDVTLALALVSKERAYCRPIVNDGCVVAFFFSGSSRPVCGCSLFLCLLSSMWLTDFTRSL